MVIRKAKFCKNLAINEGLRKSRRSTGKWMLKKLVAKCLRVHEIHGIRSSWNAARPIAPVLVSLHDVSRANGYGSLLVSSTV